MNKIVRPPAPGWLREKYKEWGRNWEKRYHDPDPKKSKKFHWCQHDKHGYDDLVTILSGMTKNHCSFCDAYPMRSRMRCTVEHFRPKTKSPKLAYAWANLFLCCDLCQEKGDDFDKKLLKPDQPNYDFDLYFEIDWATGELHPNRVALQEERERAEVTISLYHLNDNGKPEDRLDELEKFVDSINPDIDKWSYRFFIERGL
jgi:uncharacterized protein (TIGR02646 family)